MDRNISLELDEDIEQSFFVAACENHPSGNEHGTGGLGERLRVSDTYLPNCIVRLWEPVRFPRRLGLRGCEREHGQLDQRQRKAQRLRRIGQGGGGYEC